MPVWCRLSPAPEFELHIATTERGVCALSIGQSDAEFVSSLRLRYPAAACDHSSLDRVLDETRTQLGEYFAGCRRHFELPLDLQGSPFQLAVWEALQQIPFGETRTYSEIGKAVGCVSARAVGGANGRNPVAIVVPCHRVIGAGGDLRGFAAGVTRKRLLLDLERPKTLFD